MPATPLPKDAPAAGASSDTPSLDLTADQVMESLYGGVAPKDPPPETPKAPAAAPPAEKPPVKPAATKEPETPATPKATEEPPKPWPAVKPPAATPPPPTPEPAFNADDLADRVAARLKPKETPAPVTDPDASLEAEDREKLAVLHYMGEQDPKLATKEAEYRDFLKKEADYVAKWTAANPGKDFEGDDAEHEDFYEKVTPELDDKTVRRWETEMIAEAKARKLVEGERQRQQRTSVEETIRTNIGEMARAVSKEVLLEVAGKDVKDLKTLAEDDPLAAEAVYEVASQAQTLVAAAEALLTPGTPYKVNPNDPGHQELLYRLLHPPEAVADGTQKLSYEGEIAALPYEEQLWTMPDGVRRAFVTLDQYNQLRPEQRGSYWTLINHPEIVASFLRRDAKAEVKGLVEKKHASARKTAAKLGFQPPPAAPDAGLEHPLLKAAKPAPAAAPAGSPSLGGGAQPVTTLGVPKTGEENWSDLIQKGLYG